MTTLDLANQVLSKLRGFKLPTINRAKVKKFFNDAFLDLDDTDHRDYQEPKSKLKD